MLFGRCSYDVVEDISRSDWDKVQQGCYCLFISWFVYVKMTSLRWDKNKDQILKVHLYPSIPYKYNSHSFGGLSKSYFLHAAWRSYISMYYRTLSNERIIVKFDQGQVVIGINKSYLMMVVKTWCLCFGIFSAVLSLMLSWHLALFLSYSVLMYRVI